MASNNGHTTTVDILLNRGANPNIANNVSEVFLPFEVQSEHTFISCDDMIVELDSANPSIANKTDIFADFFSSCF